MATKKFRVYPATPNTRSGGKVGWRYYDRLIDAKACANAARHNAKLLAAEGYDFGYCCPGSITEIEDRDNFTVKYEVCIP